MEPIRALVADDEPEAREGVIGLLRADADIEVVAECATGSDALSSIEARRPDVAFLDIQMPGSTGSASPGPWARSACPSSSS